MFLKAYMHKKEMAEIHFYANNITEKTAIKCYQSHISMLNVKITTI